MNPKISLILFLTTLTLYAKNLPQHWICGPYQPNTGNPIMRVDYLEKTDSLQLSLEQDWVKNYGSLPKGTYFTPSHPTSSGMSRYVRMDVTRYFPHLTKPELTAFLTFTLSYTASAFISEIYVLWDDPLEPSSGNILAEYLCEAY